MSNSNTNARTRSRIATGRDDSMPVTKRPKGAVVDALVVSEGTAWATAMRGSMEMSEPRGTLARTTWGRMLAVRCMLARVPQHSPPTPTPTYRQLAKGEPRREVVSVYIGVRDALEPPQPIPPLLLLNHSQGSVACAATTHGRQPAQQPHKQAVCFPACGHNT